MKKQMYKLGFVVFLGLATLVNAQVQEGVVGINTETPDATLDIKTKAGTDKSLRVENISGTETVTVLENGNVGIGTKNPISKFTIDAKGDGMELLRFQTERPWVFKQEGSGSVAGITLYSEVGDKYFKVSNLNNEAVATFYAGAEMAGNRVGIGVDVPTEKLDVAGSIKSSDLAGTGTRNVVADENGKLIIGEAVSSGSSDETLVIKKTVKVIPNTVDSGNGLANTAAEGKNLRNYNGTSVPDYEDSDYMIVLTNDGVNGNLQLPSAKANPGRIIYLINGTTRPLGFSATGTGTEDTYPFNFATISTRVGVGFVSTGKTWYTIGR